MTSKQSSRVKLNSLELVENI